ncbi:MAG: rhodanese-like domain-containing protein [Acidobacteriota bacterium]|nr:rhodanese-like domain-containing protein [Blastocatellia bacterium]MDW8413723.1 rhodanese-like domain-containing protein [Acidobacteriota bacterium]
MLLLVLLLVLQMQEDILITAEETLTLLARKQQVLIIDARSESHYRASPNKIAGDVRLDDFANVDELLKDVPKDRIIVAYCTCPDEATSSSLAYMLRNKGYNKAYALKDGYYGWLRADGPIEPKNIRP